MVFVRILFVYSPHCLLSKARFQVCACVSLSERARLFVCVYYQHWDAFVLPTLRCARPCARVQKHFQQTQLNKEFPKYFWLVVWFFTSPAGEPFRPAHRSLAWTHTCSGMKKCNGLNSGHLYLFESKLFVRYKRVCKNKLFLEWFKV